MITSDFPNTFGKLVEQDSISASEPDELAAFKEISNRLLYHSAGEVPSYIAFIKMESQNMNLIHYIRRLMKNTWLQNEDYQQLFKDPIIRKDIEEAIGELENKIVLHYKQILKSW